MLIRIPYGRRRRLASIAGRRREHPRVGEEPGGRNAVPGPMRGKTARPSQGSLFMTMPTTFRRGASAIALGLALTVILPGAAMAQDAGTVPVDDAAAVEEIGREHV